MSGIPTISESFLRGQAVLYEQFNDINFYVEDKDQENFYFVLLKKLFPDVKFEKIFPLGGKNFVIEAARKSKSKKKVFIVDKDFDDILKKSVKKNNLFYLDRYSIENYLIEEKAIKDFIKEEKPKIKDFQIENIFNTKTFKKEAVNLFREICSIYLVIQKHSLGIENAKTAPERYCVFKPNATIRMATYNEYRKTVEDALKLKSKRLSLMAQIKNFLKHFSLRNIDDAMRHIPGKYLLKFLKAKLELLFSVSQSINIESFTFRLCKLCDLNELNYLRLGISTFIK